MRVRLETLLVSSLLILTAHQASAEQTPMLNPSSHAPSWAAGQIPITWGDCIPVPVVPMGQQMPLVPMPYPMQGGMPMMIPNNQPMLSPPSPFFNSPQAPAPTAPNIQAACDNTNELKLEALQTRYNQGAAASRKNIEELRQALEDTQNQMTDGRSLIEGLSSDKKALEGKITDLENTNKTLTAKLGSSEKNFGDQARKLTALGNKGAVLAALQSSYKDRNNENAKLKNKLTKLESFKTANTLKSAQDSNTISALKKKLADLNSTNITLKSKMATAESTAGAQARKLTAMGQPTAELTALKSAYKQRNNDNADLRKKLADLSNANITLKTKMATAASNAGANARKLTALKQSTTELAALKSAYKERNDESADLKSKLAKLETFKTASTLKSAQDNNTISALKKKLADLKNAHITLQTKLSSAESSAGSQARKLTALGQSATELTALRSAYKDKNEEARILKSQLAQLKNSLDIANSCKSKASTLANSLSDSDDKNKSLLAKIGTLESQLSSKTRKINALTAAAGELAALRSAYKDLNNTKADLSEKLTKATADSDKDGVLDNADQCPTSPAGSEVNEVGCPKVVDSDGDTVADANDLCPNTISGTTVNEFGCAPTESITLDGVNFDTGSAHLTASSLPIIKAAANTLSQHSNLNIEISGYTDNQGGKAINQQLSQRRANTVMIELIKNNVKADRLSAKGYGEKNPVASNATNKGRATNRRVELKILK